MRTIEQQIFPYSELSTAAQQKVHNDYIEGMESDWHDSTIEDAQQVAGHLGIYPIGIYYRGFSSQGDGACFVGRWYRRQVNVEALKVYAPIDETLHNIAEELAKAPDGLFVDITHTSNYYHENTMQFEFNAQDEVEDFVPDPDAVRASLRRFAKWIYRQLETEYSHRISLEAFEEQEADSENEYYEDGRLYTGD